MLSSYEVLLVAAAARGLVLAFVVLPLSDGDQGHEADGHGDRQDEAEKPVEEGGERIE